jgi:LPPG:FO 2-phospho-L-lactate transferase
VVELSGGVGGARLARGLDQVPGIDLTIVVNVGDDDDIHGLRVSADLDTVVYSLAGLEGPHGWGRRGDSFITNDELGRLGANNTFQLGDLDLAMNIMRTAALADGQTLSEFTRGVTDRLGIGASVVPATDDRVATMITTPTGEELSFQEYFVIRGHQDHVESLRFADAEKATPTPGVIESILGADLVIIGPSNPPLSIWPILAIDGYEQALRDHSAVVAVSPLFGGKALKGPAAEVMTTLGLGADNTGIVAAYDGLIDRLIVNDGDEPESGHIGEVEVRSTNTHISDPGAAAAFAKWLVSQ